ncbi:unnamed protein product [Tuber aestivum]|uniref:PIPK domain-containing protein n=1 Tax=Tuber aestivum TaxID=59557 RepID=A0A292PWF4_9PEZI|nr:unnamed protein product [Tuber aestivum]
MSNKGVFTCLLSPLLSTKYRTDMTIHCLLRPFRDPLASGDELQLQTEEMNYMVGVPHNSQWSPPEIKQHFSLGTFFSLCMFSRHSELNLTELTKIIYIDYAHFRRAAPLLFHHLRKDVFKLDEEHYQNQFTKKLCPADGLGFSGSLFFYSDDKSLIVKSIGRRFEYAFLYTTLMNPLSKYYREHPGTLLSEITDVLYTFDYRLGGCLGVSPSHYIVMANVLEGLDKGKGCKKWDLKPQGFFEPTRDLVPDHMKTEAAKSGLANGLDEEIVLARKQKAHLMSTLKTDTAFLERMEAIDYSILLGRYPISMFHKETGTGKGRDGLALPKRGKMDFVRGVVSADGKWVYKLCVLDFFWNVKQLHPRIIRAAGAALPEQTITTEPGRYREEFLKYATFRPGGKTQRMMDGYIVVSDDDGGGGDDE